ncbi:hypothetical protein ICM05_01200 [Leucobacter sp. cx-42]|uniref:hypothetical protein n=1 Tax=unclassified Leucobacter TaxID=2621730 RepID=UPI00165DF3B3|nr:MULTISPECIES: hypothetical protein [unclassified Leucobacter]MBC9953265.1 hypothetical protein [Leucobacter sp. cx-42]
MSKRLFPVFASTTDSGVIAVIERNKAAKAEVRDRATEFAKKHGDQDGNFYYSTFAGYRCTGIASNEKPTSGRWKKAHRTANGWIPYANNPLNSEFEALVHQPEKVPGVPDLLTGVSDSDGMMRVGNPTLIVLDGVAYSGTTIQASDLFPVEGGWAEIKASEFHAALEDYNERLMGAE